EAPLLAARESERVRGRDLREIEALQELAYAPLDLVTGEAGRPWADPELVVDSRGDELMLRILEYRADPPHQRARRQTRWILAERAHLAALGLKQPREEHREPRLPAAV